VIITCADEVLGRFTDGNGDFSMAYSKDIRGLLSLQDISHMNIGAEASLYKAKEFTSRNLQSAIDYLEPGLARYVRQSLEHPYHVSLMQYKARHHLSYLQTLPTRCTAMEELALADFKLNKLLHQMEMQEIKRYYINTYIKWKSLRIYGFWLSLKQIIEAIVAVDYHFDK
jgi:(3S)-linalool synthase